MKNYTFLLLLQVFIVNYCLGQLSQGLDCFNLIAENNQSVTESVNQNIINWNKVPFKIDGASRIKQTYYYVQIDSTFNSDTTILIDSKVNNATMIATSRLNFNYLKNDTLKIIKDNSQIFTYNNNQLISKEINGKKLVFNYYSSGQIKDLFVANKPLLDSKKVNDTINYKMYYLHSIDNQTTESKLISEKMIKCIKRNNGCFNYKKILFLKKISDLPILSKEIVQCNNGNITKDIEYNPNTHYTKKSKDYDFEYENLRIKRKISKPEVEYSEYKNIDYEYDSNGNLIKIIGSIITVKFEYDTRNNVISRIDYFTDSKELQQFWIREIEYLK